jgi:hypothetical protein
MAKPGAEIRLRVNGWTVHPSTRGHEREHRTEHARRADRLR